MQGTEPVEIGALGHPVVRVLVMHGDRPLGTVELASEDDKVSAEGLGHRFQSAFGSELQAPPFRFADLLASRERLPRVSVVVASHVRQPAQLALAVEKLASLDYPDFEVIVVDNRSAPRGGEPADLARLAGLAGPRTRVVNEPRRGASAARNRGIAEATGEVVAFVDDDDLVSQSWLLGLVSALDDPAVAAAVGLLVPMELAMPAQLWSESYIRMTPPSYVPATYSMDSTVGWLRRGPSLYATGGFGRGSNLALRTEVARELGGFDEALGPGTPAKAGEDLGLLIRLLTSGRSIQYEPGAIVWRQLRPSYEELEEQLRGYGTGFTAMLTSLVLEDPRHVVGLFGMLPRAFSRRGAGGGGGAGSRSEGRAGTEQSLLDRRLLRADRLGMLAGPLAYASGRVRLRLSHRLSRRLSRRLRGSRAAASGRST